MKWKEIEVFLFYENFKAIFPPGNKSIQKSQTPDPPKYFTQ